MNVNNRFTHIEAEYAFISFEQLLEKVEDMVLEILLKVVSIVECLQKNKKTAKIIGDLNPSFKSLKKPFRRMEYSEAIVWLNRNRVLKTEVDQEGIEIQREYTFGDDIPESAERFMTDTLNEPILLTRFPVALKSFYMKRCLDNKDLTESFDLLVPGVGEIIGGSKIRV